MLSDARGVQYFSAKNQNAGDLIYVPANWKHMTLNIGESIGVGGQAVYAGEVRHTHEKKPREKRLFYVNTLCCCLYAPDIGVACVFIMRRASAAGRRSGCLRRRGEKDTREKKREKRLFMLTLSIVACMQLISVSRVCL